jgi:hypothetical protein
MDKDDFRHTPTHSASENRATEEVSQNSFTELEHSESNYESTLRGAELARFHLKQAQERALRASVAYEQQLAERIEADSRRRKEVLAELDKLRRATKQTETEPEPETDPGFYYESWD